MAQQKLLLGHVKGDKGDPGADGINGKDGIDAKIASATATVTPGHLDQPTATVEIGGDAGAQTMEISFAGLQGPKGDRGETGPAYKPSGTSSQVLMGDGTPKDAATLATEDIAPALNADTWDRTSEIVANDQWPLADLAEVDMDAVKAFWTSLKGRSDELDARITELEAKYQ